jgi:hypothetical protein
MTRRCILVAITLFSGWGYSTYLYLTAVPPEENPFAEYENSKRFANSVERMGGKLSLVANDLLSWFGGLWKGETLAYTVAVITLAVAVCLYIVLTILEADVDPESVTPDSVS